VSISIDEASQLGPPVGRLFEAVCQDLESVGFTLHDCVHNSGPGRVCVTSVGEFGVLVTWNQPSADDAVDGEVIQSIQVAMNTSITVVLDLLGYGVEEFGLGSACRVMGRNR